MSRTSSPTSLRAYARHRGCHLNSVQAAIKSGRITAALVKDENGKTRGIDFAIADKLWAVNTDPAAVAKGRAKRVPKSSTTKPRHLRTSAEKPNAEVRDRTEPPVSVTGGTPGREIPQSSPVASAPDAAVSVDPSGDYYDHRAKHEKFKAATAELEYHKFAGSLVESAVVEREQFLIWRRVRDMFQLAFDHADATLATIPAASRVRIQLRAESRQMLDELAKNLDDSSRTGDEREETSTEIGS